MATHLAGVGHRGAVVAAAGELRALQLLVRPAVAVRVLAAAVSGARPARAAHALAAGRGGVAKLGCGVAKLHVAAGGRRGGGC